MEGVGIFWGGGFGGVEVVFIDMGRCGERESYGIPHN